MIELWMVRHGETDWNVEGRIQGWTDVPLNQAGIRQAQILALDMEGIPFHHFITSDLKRARTTARILQPLVAFPVIECSLLRERGFGEAEGMLRAEARQKYSDTFPGEESYEDVLLRGERFLSYVGQTWPARRTLAVSHGGFIRVLLHLAGYGEDIPLRNTSVSCLIHDGTRWQVRMADDVRHLKSRGIPVSTPTLTKPTRH